MMELEAGRITRPAREEKKTMKKSLLALALGLAIVPLTFAQTAPPAEGTKPDTAAPKTKKRKKHNKKKTGATATSTAQKHAAVKSVAPATTATPTK
jgi:hypothetical protein